MAAVADNETAAAEEAAMLMSATGGSPGAQQGWGQNISLSPHLTFYSHNDSNDSSEGENDNVGPLDRQVTQSRPAWHKVSCRCLHPL